MKAHARSNQSSTHEGRAADIAARAAETAALTPAQRLARLDERLGLGVGAVKERKRLAEALQKGQATSKAGAR